MARSAAWFVGEALAAWILDRLDDDNDFAREGLPNTDVFALLAALGKGGLPAEEFSLALVGFGIDENGIRSAAAEHGLVRLAAITTDLHVATEWRNRREQHPRIVALAMGYNPSVHGLGFFSRASSSELASYLLTWAAMEKRFSATPQHLALIETLRTHTALAGLRSLEGISEYLASWDAAAPGSIDAPREALPSLGLLADPRLFEADDLGKRLVTNLVVGERITILTPSEIRQRRQRVARYADRDQATEVALALDRLDVHRRAGGRSDLTLDDAQKLVRLPADNPNKAEAPTSAPTEGGGRHWRCWPGAR